MPETAHSHDLRRSEAAIRNDSPQMLDRDDPGVDDATRRILWRKAAIVSNAAYLAALAQAGYRVTACG